MDKIFVDTNIVLDLLGGREPWWKEAQQLFNLGARGKAKLFISALTIANTHYILSARMKKKAEAKKILRRFKTLVEVLPLDAKVIDWALESEFKDFEDGLQYYTAIQNDVRILVTRNLKDFKPAQITVMTAAEYLRTLE